jgi:hypothetical protein
MHPAVSLEQLLMMQSEVMNLLV